MKRIIVAVAFVLASVVARADSIIIVGAGNPAPWDTDIEVANPTDAPLEVQLGALPDFEPVVCGTECIIVHYTVPANGSIKLTSIDVPNIAHRTLRRNHPRVRPGRCSPRDCQRSFEKSWQS